MHSLARGELFSDYMRKSVCVCFFPTSKAWMEAVLSIARDARIGAKVINKIAFLQKKQKTLPRD